MRLACDASLWYSPEYRVHRVLCSLPVAARRAAQVQRNNATQRARSKFRVREREQRSRSNGAFSNCHFKCALEAHISIAERSATQHAFTSMSHCVMLHNTTIPYALRMRTFARPRFASHSLSQSGSARLVRACRTHEQSIQSLQSDVHAPLNHDNTTAIAAHCVTATATVQRPPTCLREPSSSSQMAPRKSTNQRMPIPIPT